MDPELRAYLDSMRAEMAAMNGKIDKTREALDALDTKIDKTRGALESKIDEARREAGAMMDAIIHEIRTLPKVSLRSNAKKQSAWMPNAKKRS